MASDTDTDNDGIPDDWEAYYGLDPNNPTDANNDNDNDSIINLDEYINYTDPLVNESSKDRIGFGGFFPLWYNPSGGYTTYLVKPIIDTNQSSSNRSLIMNYGNIINQTFKPSLDVITNIILNGFVAKPRNH
jgi:hypothetical protein